MRVYGRRAIHLVPDLALDEPTVHAVLGQVRDVGYLHLILKIHCCAGGSSVAGARHVGHVASGPVGGSWPVVVFDDAAQALSGGGQVVFEFLDAALGVVGLGGAGVAFGE